MNPFGKISACAVCAWCLLFVVAATQANQIETVSTPRSLTGRSTCAGTVERVELINADTNQKIMDLSNGTIVETDRPSYNIKAIVSGSNVKSVQFGHNSNSRYNVENATPYAFCQNKGDDFFACNKLTYGTHTIIVTPFAQSRGRGARCASYTVQFTIARPSTATPARPPRSPTKAPIGVISDPTKAPVPSPTKAPVPSPTKAPVPAPTKAPAKPPTKAPVPAPTKAPVPLPTEAPVPTPTKAPVPDPTKAPAKPPTKAPVPAPTKAPAKPPTKAPVPAPTKAPAKPPTKAPTVPSPSNTFNIQLDAVGVPTADRPAFEAARTRWMQVIKGDVPDYATNQFPYPTLSAGYGVAVDCVLPSPTIDDLYVCADYVDYLPSGLAAQFGVSYARTDSGLPVVSSFLMVSSEAAYIKSIYDYNFLLLDVFSYMLGFSDSWRTRGVIANYCDYVGPAANAEYQALSGCGSSVRIPTSGDCKGWSGQCLGKELGGVRSYTIGPFDPNPRPALSRIMVGAMQDLGYTVDYSAAQNFTAADLDPSCRCNRRKLEAPILEPENRDKDRHRHRGLSPQGHEAALKAGRDILAAHAAAKPKEDIPGLTYMADQAVTVGMMENGHLFFVHVRKGD